MDRNAAVSTGLTWVFTLGAPEAKLLKKLRTLLAAGSFDWVLIPIYNTEIQTLRGNTAGASVSG